MEKGTSTLLLLIGEGSETKHRISEIASQSLPGSDLYARDLTTAFRFAASQPVDAVIIDSTSQDVDAVKVLTDFSGDERTSKIPVLVLNGDGEALYDQALEEGELTSHEAVSWQISDQELGCRLRWMVRAKRAEDALRAAKEKEKSVAAAHQRGLEAKERRFQRLVEIWPEMVAVCSDGLITFVNDAGLIILGQESVDELIGLPVTELVHPESREALRKMLAACDAGEEHVPFALMRLLGAKGRAVTVEAAAVCVAGIDGGPVLLVLRDVSERKELTERFQQSQRMEAVGQLAGGVAHDFNNILTTIRGYSDIIIDSVNPEDPLSEDAREIKNATEKAAALTRQLLAFSRRQVMEPAPLDMNQVVLNIKRMLMRVIGENIELTTDLEPDIGIVKADRSQIEQVIMNLAVNARDAIIDSGQLTLKTRNMNVEDITEADADGLDMSVESYVVLEMTDTGQGMSQETLYRIFEPFFTTKGQDRGTGLGLSTVYGIVKQSGGEITVTSQQGKGTSFNVYLPIVPDLVAAFAPVRTERGPAKGEETVLLVEDDHTVRYLTKRLLERAGYTVLPAANGAEALSVSEEHEGVIDLIVTDVVMPEMGGLELVVRLVEENPKMRAIFMSGYTNRAVMELADTLESVAFLQKPFSYAELTRKVRSVLDIKEG